VKQFYVYLHCKPDGTPFYVGKGCGKRSTDFSSRRNAQHIFIIDEIGRTKIKVMVFNCESEQQALDDEVRWISQLKEQGIELVNVSSGGQHGGTGCIPSAETRAKRSASQMGKLVGRTHTPEARAKISAAQTGRRGGTAGTKLTEEHKRKIATSMMGKKNTLGFKQSEETKLKVAMARRLRKHSQKTRDKIAAARRAYWRTRRTCMAALI